MFRNHSSPYLTFLLVIALARGAIAKGFLTASSYPTGEFPTAAVVQDFNNDGISDLATANLNDRNVSVLLGESGGQFGAAMTLSVGAAVAELASADLNSDGNADLVVTDGIKSAHIILGKGDGTFRAPSRISLHNNPLGIETADFNGDSKLDLAIAIFGPENNSQGEVAVLLGNGDGSFGAPIYHRLGHNANRLVAVKLNGDGKLDLAVAVQHFGTLRNSLAVLLGNGDGTFQSPMLSVPGVAVDVAGGDLNGDGKIDLVLAAEFSDAVKVLLGKGDGTFRRPVIYDVTGSAATVMLANLNHDRAMDIVAGGGDGANVLLGKGDGAFGHVMAYGVGTQFAVVGKFNRDPAPDIVAGGFDSINLAFGNGDGTFRAPLVYSAGALIHALASADFDRDANPDLIVGRQPFEPGGKTTLYILLGDGHGGLLPAGTFSNVIPSEVKIGDFNGDSKPDVSVTARDSNGVFIYLGNGDATFQPGKKTNVPSPVGQALGDFNHDCRLDLAITPEFIDKISILLGNGDGTFQPAINYPTGDVPQSPTATDFDSDGNLDLAVANTFSSTVGVYLGNGDGTFQPALLTQTTNPVFMLTADFDCDHRPDVVIGGSGTKLLLGKGNGTFKPSRTLLSAYGPMETADVDGDGKLDLAVAADFAELDVLRGRGDGSFRPAQAFTTGGIFADEPVLIDLNHDTLPEAVVSNISEAFAVLLNTP